METIHSVRLVDKQFEFNLWANTQLIETCSTLDAAQLEIEEDGVFGRIHPTIVHILQGEGNYLRDLDGANPWANITDWDTLTFDQLLAMAKRSGAALREAAKQGDPDQTIEYEDEDEYDEGEYGAKAMMDPAPAGTVQPPQNGLFGNGAAPKVEMK